MREENVWGVAVALFSGFLFAFSVAVFSFSAGSDGRPVAQDAPEAQSTTVHVPSNDGVAELYESFQATAYCISGITFSGVKVAEGIVAADPRILPIGSVIEVKASTYSGIYTVLDIGTEIQGSIIDIYLSDYRRALQFGRQRVKIRVLRRGWNISDPSSPVKYSPAG